MNRLIFKFSLSFIILGLAAALLSGIFLYITYERYIGNNVNQQLEACINMLNDQYDLSDLDRYESLGEVKDQEYISLLQQWTAVADAYGYAYIYAMKPGPDDSFIFILDIANLSSDEDDWSFQYEYDDAPPEILETYRTGNKILAEPYTDQWGTFQSMYAPIVDSSGKTTGVLGVDYDISFVEGLKRKALTTFFIAVFASVVLAIITGYLLALSLTKPIKAAALTVDEIAKGNLLTKITIDRKDEIGDLLKSMRNMIDRLLPVISSVSMISRQVSQGSEELRTTSQNLASGASEQAASTEEVSASMEEMSATISNSSENAVQTESIAVQSAQEAESSGKAVDEAIGAMKKIIEKISIIGEIARQTNLLALNAAIEAARAGEHGKGFAVVASEVRKLAERSQVAASEILELSSSTGEVATSAGLSLEKLVPGIRKTSELVQEISASTTEQHSGISQINNALTQLDSVTQQNAAFAEELAGNSISLKEQADELSEVIKFFNV